MAPEINESQGKHSGDGEAICANPGLVTQPANNDKLPFGHKPDPAVGCEQPVWRKGEVLFPTGIESFWTLIFLKLSLCDKCRVPKAEENK